MRTLIHADIKKWNKIFYMLCIGATGVLLLYAVRGALYQEVVMVLSELLWLLLFVWVKKSGSGYLLLPGILLVAAGTALYLYKSGRDMEPFWQLLGLEAICLGCAVTAGLCSRYFILKLLVLTSEIAGMIYCAISGIEVPKWGVCMILFCVLMLLTELAELAAKRHGGLDPLVLTPVFVCLLLGLWFLPVKETPAEWKTVKKTWDLAQEKVTAVVTEIEYALFGEDTSAFSFTGYGEGSTLGGSIFEGKQPQISIKTDRMKAPLYIAGSIYDNYTGSGWEQTTETGEAYDYPYQTVGQALEKSIYSKEEIKELTHLRFGEIKYEGIHTRSLFLPSLVKEVVLPENKKAEETGRGNLKLKKAQGVGFTYRMSFLEADYGNEKMKSLMRQEAWKEKPVLSEEEQKLKDKIYHTYTVLPETIPERVYELADEITEGLSNDYDRLCAIAAYLKQFEYSKKVENVPEGADPVDYFLFESRKGYCTYFASAMTILGRCEGIPMRYVEGFATDKVTKRKQKEIMLTGSEAHAWAEAYIENIGWVHMEATPGYTGPSDEAWKSVPAKSNSGEAQKPVLSEAEQDKLQEMSEGQEVIPANVENGLLEMVKKVLILLLKVLLYLLGFAAIMTLMVWCRRSYRKKKYYAGADIDKWRELLKRILFIGHLLGEDMSAGEPLGTFKRSVGSVLDVEDETFAAFCKDYEKNRFGLHKENAEALCRAEQYVLKLEKQYIKNCSFMQRVLYLLK